MAGNMTRGPLFGTLATLLLCLIVMAAADAGGKEKGMTEAIKDANIQQKANESHSIIWEHFFEPENKMIYTVIDPYEKGRINLPTLEEVANDIPNSAGWGTPIENCSISGGGYLEPLIARYEVTGKPEHAEEVRQIYQGLYKIWQSSSSAGFLPRGVMPDGKTHYKDSSVDQYTLWLYGVWRYYRSGLASEKEKADIRRAVAGLMLDIEKKGFTLCREDGKVTTFGNISAMSERLPIIVLMLPAISYDVTKDKHWLDVYRYKRDENDQVRLKWCLNPKAVDTAAWTLVQAQLALRALYELESEPAAKKIYEEALNTSTRNAARQVQAFERYDPGLESTYDHDTQLEIVSNPISGLGVIIRAADEKLARDLVPLCKQVIAGYNFRRCKGVGALKSVENYYWLACKRGFIDYDPSLDVPVDVEIELIPEGTIYHQHIKDWYIPWEHRYQRVP